MAQNTPEAAALFGEAKAHKDEISRLIESYNKIAEMLQRMGYVWRVDGYGFGDGSVWPLPDLELWGNGQHLDPEFLKKFWEAGPQPLTNSAAYYLGLMTDAEFFSKRTRDHALFAHDSGNQEIRRSSLTVERMALGKESGWVCFYCRRAGSEKCGPDNRLWHVDHVYPISRGGDNQNDNLVLACATCNLQKHAKSALEYFAAMAG